jgi:hypothetical protein
MKSGKQRQERRGSFADMRGILTRILPVFLLVTGCASVHDHPSKRTDQLRQIYPAGTSRQAVQAKWGKIKPDFSASRPANGWQAYQNQYIATKIKNVEVITGKQVDSVDRY